MKKYPKIGIRPTIDGRQGGVRESLEEKTMNLAKAVAELIRDVYKRQHKYTPNFNNFQQTYNIHTPIKNISSLSYSLSVLK